VKKPRLRFRAEAFQKGAGNGARESQTVLLWLRKAEGSAGLVALWLRIRSVGVPRTCHRRTASGSQYRLQFGRASRGTGEPPTGLMQAAR